MQNGYIEQDIKSLKEIFCRLLNREGIAEDEDIYYAGLTSLMVLPLVVEIEETFKLAIPDSDFLNVRTLRSLAQMIQQIRSQQSQALRGATT